MLFADLPIAPRPGALLALAVHRRSYLIAALAESVLGAVVVVANVGCSVGTGVGLLLVSAATLQIAFVIIADVAAWIIAKRGRHPIDYGIGDQTLALDAPGAQPFRDMHVRRVLVGDAARAAAVLRQFLGRDVGALLLVLLCATSVPMTSRARPCQRGHRAAAMAVAGHLRTATVSWKATHPGPGCPTPAELKAEQELDVSANLKDAWGGLFVITCDGDEIVVTSPGPDERLGTEDDIRAPR